MILFSRGDSVELGSTIGGVGDRVVLGQPFLCLQIQDRKAVPSEEIVTWWLCSLLIATTWQVCYKEKPQILEKAHGFVKLINMLLENCQNRMQSHGQMFLGRVRSVNDQRRET